MFNPVPPADPKGQPEEPQPPLEGDVFREEPWNTAEDDWSEHGEAGDLLAGMPEPQVQVVSHLAATMTAFGAGLIVLGSLLLLFGVAVGFSILEWLIREAPRGPEIARSVVFLTWDGLVFLLGAGIGVTGILTRRAARLFRQAAAAKGDATWPLAHALRHLAFVYRLKICLFISVALAIGFCLVITCGVSP